MTESPGVQHRPVGVMILPSMLTVAALCAGLTGVRFAADGKVDLAIMLVVIAAILISALTGLLTFDNLASTVTVVTLIAAVVLFGMILSSKEIDAIERSRVIALLTSGESATSPALISVRTLPTPSPLSRLPS